jgi:hypothetical protein
VTAVEYFKKIFEGSEKPSSETTRVNKIEKPAPSQKALAKNKDAYLIGVKKPKTSRK